MAHALEVGFQKVAQAVGQLHGQAFVAVGQAAQHAGPAMQQLSSKIAQGLEQLPQHTKHMRPIIEKIGNDEHLVRNLAIGATSVVAIAAPGLVVGLVLSIAGFGSTGVGAGKFLSIMFRTYFFTSHTNTFIS